MSDSELVTRAREATSQLRDAAREGRIIEFRQRDELVLAIHRALDQVGCVSEPVRDRERVTPEEKDHGAALLPGDPSAAGSGTTDHSTTVVSRDR